MTRRGEVAPSRRVGGRFVLAATLVLIILSAAGSASCGSSTADVGVYLGEWQRVEAGAPNPDFTLIITAQGDGASLSFADKVRGASETVAGTAGDGYLACALPTGADDAIGSSASASPVTPPANADVQLSLDSGGQLVADLVLADGTLEPIWVYERSSSSSPLE